MNRTMAAAVLGAMALSLAACGGNGDDTLARNVEKAYDNRADALDQAADNMKDEAKQLRRNGEQQADAIVLRRELIGAVQPVERVLRESMTLW